MRCEILNVEGVARQVAGGKSIARLAALPEPIVLQITSIYPF
jgi:hypothetical protein